MLNVQLLLDADVPRGRCVKYTLAILASAETGLLPCLPDLTTKGCERIGDVLEAVGGVLAPEMQAAHSLMKPDGVGGLVAGGALKGATCHERAVARQGLAVALGDGADGLDRR